MKTIVPTFPDRRCASCDALGRGCLAHLLIRDEPTQTLRPVFPVRGTIISKQIRDTVTRIRRRKVEFSFELCDRLTDEQLKARGISLPPLSQEDMRRVCAPRNPTTPNQER